MLIWHTDAKFLIAHPPVSCLVPSFHTGANGVRQRTKQPAGFCRAVQGTHLHKPFHRQMNKRIRFPVITIQQFPGTLEKFLLVVYPCEAVIFQHFDLTFIYRIEHPEPDNPWVENLRDKIPYAKFQTPALVFYICTGSCHYDGDISIYIFLFELFQKLETIHHRHHQIQNDQGDVILLFLQHPEGYFTVFRFQYFIGILQNIGKCHPVHPGIIHD